MRPLRYSSRAFSEAEEAALFYEGCSPGLGVRFQDALDELLDKIQEHPYIGVRLSSTVRRAIVPGFPYNVYYNVSEEEILLASIGHQKRRPRNWQRFSTRKKSGA